MQGIASESTGLEAEDTSDYCQIEDVGIEAAGREFLTGMMDIEFDSLNDTNCDIEELAFEVGRIMLPVMLLTS